MERTPCPITGSGDFTPVMQAPDRFNLHGTSWQIARSADSGLLMLDPRPDQHEMAAHYPVRGYAPFLHAGNARTLRDRIHITLASLLLRKKATIVMSGLEKSPASANILETGCAAGNLLLSLHRHYRIPLRNLFGIEPDHRSAEAARASGLLNIAENEMADTVFNRTFDRIIFWHVLEHLHRIAETLDRAHQLLTPEGIMVLALPNIDSDDAQRYGPHWIALDAPRHLYHFSPDTLEKLLTKHGFAILDLHRWIPDTLYNVWHSEKLDRTIGNRPLGIAGITTAAANTARSLHAGRNPRRASSIIVRAIKTTQQTLHTN